MSLDVLDFCIFFEKCPLKSSELKFLIDFLLLTSKGFIYSDAKPSSDTWLANIISNYVGCLITTFLIISFDLIPKVFKFDEIQFIHFFLLLLVLFLKLIAKPKVANLSLCFLKEFYEFSIFI